MKKVPLGGKHGVNRFALVDDEDYAWISQFKWYAAKSGLTFYAHSSVYKNRLLMHRLIMGFPKKQIDHINHNGLDNRRKNLRECTYGENQRNRRGLISTNSSGYLGVSWVASDSVWLAQIVYDKKYYYLGRHTNKKKAAKAVRDFLKQRGG